MKDEETVAYLKKAKKIINGVAVTPSLRKEIETLKKDFTSFNSLKDMESEALTNTKYTMQERLYIYYSLIVYFFSEEEATDALIEVISSKYVAIELAKQV